MSKRTTVVHGGDMGGNEGHGDPSSMVRRKPRRVCGCCSPLLLAVCCLGGIYACGIIIYLKSLMDDGSSSQPPSSQRTSRIDAYDRIELLQDSPAVRNLMCDAVTMLPMRYWQPRDDDSEFNSPYSWFGYGGSFERGSQSPRTKKYVSFEADYGGFNNIRMTMETLVVFAKATGRTIVLPPRSPIYLLGKGHDEQKKEKNKNKKNKLLSVADFFSEGIAQLGRSGLVEIIHFDEFIAREGSDGLVWRATAVKKNASSLSEEDAVRQVLRWSEAAEQGEDAARKELRTWTRQAACGREEDDDEGKEEEPDVEEGDRCPKWSPLKEVVVWATDKRRRDSISAQGQAAPWFAPGEMPHTFSLAEFVTGRRRARFLDAHTAGTPWVHFRTELKTDTRPLFTHWYTLFLFEDLATDLYMKRLVRDYLHYDERVFCVAARIIRKLDDEGRDIGEAGVVQGARGGGGGGGGDGSGVASGIGWSSMHVRHGELQYTDIQLSPRSIMNATSKWLNKPRELLYIATDEPDLGWFDPFRERFETRYLSDFPEETALLPEEERHRLLGMVEQVVLSHGRTFTGTWFSTFSSYVCRLRGWYDTHHRGAAARGAIASLLEEDAPMREGPRRWLGRSRSFPDGSCFVYAPDHKRLDFQEWKMPSHAFYVREWPLAWEDINHLRRRVGSAHQDGHRAAGNRDDVYSAANRFSADLPPLSLQRLRYSNFVHEEPKYPDEAVQRAKAQRKREKAANLAARDAKW